MKEHRFFRAFLLVALASSVFAVMATPAQAAHRVYCGNWGYVQDRGAMGWTYGEVDGAGIFDVYAYKVGCHTARRVARSGKTKSFGFTCRYVKRAYEFSKQRCTRGPRIISFSSGA